ncbi:MAG: hypothetical protein AB7J35_00345 [Dehalococcoidia bacterium]
MSDGLRLTEILTTSSAVANYLGSPLIMPSHLLAAIEILEGSRTLDDLGRPLSPLVSRVARAGDAVAPEIRELARRWFAELGGDPTAELEGEELQRFTQELRVLAAESGE